ncbi:MAG: serpin family protein [Lachnospiraceae bacterium]|nr:serpin family protein [Lachnospiraceae bacterium]
MRSEDLFEAMGDIDEKEIEAADNYRPKKKAPLKWVLPAACAAAAVLLLLIGIPLIRNAQKNPNVPNTPGNEEGSYELKVLSAEYPEAVGGNLSAEEYMTDDARWDWLDEQQKNYDASAALQKDMENCYLSLMAQILASDEENTVCSPLNAYMAFAMLAETADGNTRKQILDTLGVPDIKTLRKNTHALWSSNYADTPVLKSLLANSVWLNAAENYNEDTLKTLAHEYYASSYRGVPGSDEMNAALQDWTNKNTGGLLKDYVKDLKLEPDTVLALVSTIYYKATWLNDFNKDENTRETFHGVKGDTTVDMMHNSDCSELFESDRFTALSLGLNDSGSMHFFLPKDGVDINSLASDPDVLKAISTEDDARRSYPMVNMSIPAFKVSCKTDLLDTMSALGMTDALDPGRADFSPLKPDAAGLYVSAAEHAAFVEIDEQGVTGAAYTEIAMTKGAFFSDDPVDFVLDRPFLFIISGSDGSVLFSGIVRNID